jgi:DNA-binding GntR family transcriptional regulator
VNAQTLSKALSGLVADGALHQRLGRGAFANGDNHPVGIRDLGDIEWTGNGNRSYR